MSNSCENYGSAHPTARYRKARNQATLEIFTNKVSPTLEDDGPIINRNQNAPFYLQDDKWYDKETFEFMSPVVKDIEEYDEDAYGGLVGASTMLPNTGELQPVKFIRRKRDNEENIIGKKSNNPLQDTSLCKVDFSSGKIKEYMQMC